MKKLNLMALLLGATLFSGLGAVSLSAEGMKCGAGKCGNSMNQPAKSTAKCGGEKRSLNMACDAKKCDDKNYKKNCDTTKCDDKKSAAKCGGAKKAPAAAKCGTGKCG